MMKVILYMAQTINGIIARENYNEDFLSHQNWNIFVTLAEDIGCFIVGKKTYEVVKKWEKYNFDSLNAKKIIVSRGKMSKLKNSYIYAHSPKEALDKAFELGFRKVLLAGGGTLNSSFIKAGLVDEIILNIEPFVLGRGIRIFSEEAFENKLQLRNVKKLNGIVQLHYKVRK
ncbi:MAG: dihydrofolate reductase family protein [Nanoarchaeota archaeon]|nr:dihydrofolate reductase family protein [Nanoarchaeota archaeon]